MAYFHTHYVAHFRGMVLCTACLSAQWIPVEEWRRHHLTVEPVSPFHVTHHWSLVNDEHVHHYQRERASITGLGL